MIFVAVNKLFILMDHCTNSATDAEFELSESIKENDSMNKGIRQIVYDIFHYLRMIWDS
jgi:hypothetical protein